MRNALSIGEGSWSVFIERPMSATLLALLVAVLVLPRVVVWLRRLRAAAEQARTGAAVPAPFSRARPSPARAGGRPRRPAARASCPSPAGGAR
jgi:hypothetical protein